MRARSQRNEARWTYIKGDGRINGDIMFSYEKALPMSKLVKDLGPAPICIHPGICMLNSLMYACMRAIPEGMIGLLGLKFIDKFGG